MIFSIRSTRGYDFEENHPPCLPNKEDVKRKLHEAIDTIID